MPSTAFPTNATYTSISISVGKLPVTAHPHSSAMKTKLSTSCPTEEALELALGPSITLWRLLWEELARCFPGVNREWKGCKNEFGGYCIARKSDRALLYLIPNRLKLEAAIILGERAAAIASTDAPLKRRKELIAQAPRCAAGRTIRFFVESRTDVADARRLVEIKTDHFLTGSSPGDIRA